MRARGSLLLSNLIATLKLSCLPGPSPRRRGHNVNCVHIGIWEFGKGYQLFRSQSPEKISSTYFYACRASFARRPFPDHITTIELVGNEGVTTCRARSWNHPTPSKKAVMIVLLLIWRSVASQTRTDKFMCKVRCLPVLIRARCRSSLHRANMCICYIDASVDLLHLICKR